MFVHRIPVLFPDVDWARVLYFPRYFDYAHRTFEAFWDQSGMPYVDLVTKQHLGFPTVHCEADFKAPLRFGETARVELQLTRVSMRSATCAYKMYRNDSAELCTALTIVVACTHIEQFKSVEIPAALRDVLSKHLVG